MKNQQKIPVVFFTSDKPGDEPLFGAPMRFVTLSNIIVISLLILLLVSTMVIKYPDTLEGSALITTDPPPITLKSFTAGKIANLYITNGKTVKKGDILVEVQNVPGLNKITALKAYIDTVVVLFQQRDFKALKGKELLTNLGDFQVSYNNLNSNLNAFLFFEQEQIMLKQNRQLLNQNKMYKAVSHGDMRQIELSKDELKEANDRFNSNEQLYRDKVISKYEFYEEAQRLRQKKLALEQLINEQHHTDIDIENNKKLLAETNYMYKEKELALLNNISESIRTINNEIEEWYDKYLITSPRDGKAYMIKPLQANQILEPNEALISVVPEVKNNVAHIYLSAGGLGKIKVGQKVHLLLDQYPFQEFGYLEANINTISDMPQNIDNINYFVCNINLPERLITSHHYHIKFSPSIYGKAQIITRDRTLFNRLISQTIRKSFL